MAYSWRPGSAINGTTDLSVAEIKEMTAATRHCADLLEEQIEQNEDLLVAYDELLTKYDALKRSCTCGAAVTRSSCASGVSQQSGCLIMLDEALPNPRAFSSGPSQNVSEAPTTEAQGSANVATDSVVACQATSTSGIEPYVLVLVDPRSHCFNLNLINAGQSGGDQARKLIITAVTAFIRENHQEFGNYFIKMLVVADPQTLDDAVEIYARSGDNLPSSLTLKLIVNNFVEGFRGSNTRFITINKNDNTNVEEEVAGFLEKATNESSCKQVYLAASGHAKYTRLLQSLPSTPNKIILIHHGEPDLDTAGLGYPAIEFPGVFRTSYGKRPLANKAKDTPDDQEICLEDSVDTRFPQIASHTNSARNKIPVNSSGHRLDIKLRCPTKSQFEYSNRIMSGPESGRPCTAFHSSTCEMGPKCSYSHAPISPELLHTLRFRLQRVPCKFQGLCREENCVFGHHCRLEACLHGRQKHCKFKRHTHGIDTKIYRWVGPGIAKEHSEEPTRLPVHKSPMRTPEPPSSASMQPWNESDDVDLIEL